MRLVVEVLQAVAAVRGVRLQVEVRAVGDAHQLAPAPRKAVLDVGGGLGVVRQLLVCVSAQPQPVGPYAQVGEPRHEFVHPAPVPLLVSPRPDEVLDLHLLELAGSKRKIAGGDLVAKRLADLADAERQALARGHQHVLEVDEYALRSLRPEVRLGRGVLHGADEGLEHEVEAARVGQLAAAFRARLRIDVVGAEALVAGLALHERVGEGVGVAGGDPHLGVHEDGGLQADHVVAVLDEPLPPGVANVALQLDAQRAVVVRGREAAVDLAGLEDEAPALA